MSSGDRKDQTKAPNGRNLVEAKRDDLYRALATIRSADECAQVLEDLCTPAEIAAMTDRWQAVQLVHQGMPYRQIAESTGTSTTTVTRVARALAIGAGGYRLLLKRRQHGKATERKAPKAKA